MTKALLSSTFFPEYPEGPLSSQRTISLQSARSAAAALISESIRHFGIVVLVWASHSSMRISMTSSSLWTPLHCRFWESLRMRWRQAALAQRSIQTRSAHWERRSSWKPISVMASACKAHTHIWTRKSLSPLREALWLLPSIRPSPTFLSGHSRRWLEEGPSIARRKQEAYASTMSTKNLDSQAWPVS